VKTTETGKLWDQSLRLTEITRKLKTEAGNATHFVVLDACRNTLKLTQPGPRAVVQSKGFVPVSSMFCAYGESRDALETLAALMRPFTTDAARVRRLVTDADAAGFQFYD
jgi:hypothetical protein